MCEIHREASKNFYDYLIAIIAGGNVDGRLSRRQLDERVAAANLRDSSLQNIFDKGEPISDNEGKILIVVDRPRFEMALKFIAAGLYFHVTGYRLPERLWDQVSVGIPSFHGDAERQRLEAERARSEPLLNWRMITSGHEDVFSCRVMHVPERPRTFMIELLFYGTFSASVVSSKLDVLTLVDSALDSPPDGPAAVDLERARLEDLFHAATSRTGGRLDLTMFDNPNNILNSYRNSVAVWLNEYAVKYPAMPSVHFDYVESLEFGASAFIKDGRYFIAFRSGTPVLLADMYQRMLSSRSLFLDVGEPQLEAEDGPLKQPIVVDAACLKSMQTACAARDPVRREYAMILLELSMRGLLAHEYAHLLKGHVQYLSSVNWKVSPMAWQALEFDADCSTVGNVIGMALRQGMASAARSAALRHAFGTPRQALFTALFAIYAPYWFDFSLRSDIEENEKARGRYMPPRLRQMTSSATAHAYLSDWGEIELASESGKVGAEVMIAAERAVALITGYDFGYKGMREAHRDLSPGGDSHLSKVEDEWAAIRPLLEPFALGPLPPARPDPPR